VIKGLDHINIRTAELERTRDFFVRVLGLTEGWRPPFAFNGAWLYAGGRDVVHLVEVAEPAQPSRGSALDHFAFAIEDYEEAVRRLDADGLAYRATTTPGTATRQIFVSEINGVTIELNCREPAAAS
jgi:catechol 2,3-dioxygenase-like lactoylglutathione lyase family enzyme